MNESERTNFWWRRAKAAEAKVEELTKPRLISKVEELEALPTGSLIRCPDGEIGMIMTSARDRARRVVGYPNTVPVDELADVIRNTCGDPLTVIYTPES
jgi:hypothetical protein